MLKFIFNTDKSPAQLCIRIVLGVVIFPHGAQKVLGWFGGPGFTQTLQTFSNMGFPVWSTLVLMVVELVGAVMLIFGFITRLWALGIGVAISICMFMYHLQNGFFMNWFGQQKGEGFEYHLLVIGIALALIVKGGGLLSADGVISKKTS